MEAGYVLCALFFTFLLSSLFAEVIIKCVKRTLSCWRLSSPGIYEEVFIAESLVSVGGGCWRFHATDSRRVYSTNSCRV